jgi:hypothetical protein
VPVNLKGLLCFSHTQVQQHTLLCPASDMITCSLHLFYLKTTNDFMRVFSVFINLYAGADRRCGALLSYLQSGVLKGNSLRVYVMVSWENIQAITLTYMCLAEEACICPFDTNPFYFHNNAELSPLPTSPIRINILNHRPNPLHFMIKRI